MDNYFGSRGGEEFPDVTYLMYLKKGRLAEGWHMGFQSHVFIEQFSVEFLSGPMVIDGLVGYLPHLECMKKNSVLLSLSFRWLLGIHRWTSLIQASSLARAASVLEDPELSQAIYKCESSTCAVGMDDVPQGQGVDGK